MRLVVGRVSQLVSSLADFLSESPGCGTSCGSSRDTGPGPKVPRKPRPEPCRQTARCASTSRTCCRSCSLSARGGLGRGVAAGCGRLRLTMPIERRPGHAQAAAGRGRAYLRRKFLDGLHGSLPLLSGGGRGIPRISESFFWTSMIVSAWRSLAASRWVSRVEPLVFGDQGGVGVGLPPTTLGGQSGQRPFVALLPPRAQVRRVQALAAQQGAELAGLGAAIGLAENAKLVLRGEPSPHGLLRDGRVGDRLSVACGRAPRRRGGRGGGRNCRVGPGDCSPGPLTEPDLWTTHPALWVGISQFKQQGLTRGQLGWLVQVHTTWPSATPNARETKRSGRPLSCPAYCSGTKRRDGSRPSVRQHPRSRRNATRCR